MLQGCNAPRRSITRLAIFNEPPKLIDAANGLQDKSVARPLRKRAVKIAVRFEQLDFGHALVTILGDERLLPSKCRKFDKIRVETCCRECRRLQRCPENIALIVRFDRIDHGLKCPALTARFFDPAFLLNPRKYSSDRSASGGIGAHQMCFSDHIIQSAIKAVCGNTQIERILDLIFDALGNVVLLCSVTFQYISAIQIMRQDAKTTKVAKRCVNR